MEPIEQKRPGKVLGTAGHIDHGKSALIRALTGTDPDRLAEEKQRGITIELGFAQLALPDGSTLGVVDVPGHEKFVRQMISGSTGIDLALLCIAADDGVMPQTREHVAVLELLGVPACVVALTKCDRVDDEMIELAREDVRAFLADTPYADAPIVPTSSVTGAGLDELKQKLLDVSRSLTSTRASGPVRMPVDRVFTIKGAGTVVTGTLWSGSIAPEDELEILPEKRIVRVRSVQEHDRPVARAQAGNRVAVNLPGVSTSDIRPGDFLAAPHTIEPTDRFDCRFTHVSPLVAGKPLPTGVRIRCAHGTREAFGRLLLANGRSQLGVHESAYAQIRLDEKLPISRGDRFIVRSESPVAVIGGGEALVAHPRRRTTLSDREVALLDHLRANDDAAAVADALALASAPCLADDLARTYGIPRGTCASTLSALAQKKRIRRFDGSPDGPLYATDACAQKTFAALDAALLAFHRENPTALGIKKADLLARSGLRLSERSFDALLAQAVEHGAVFADGGVLSHPTAGAAAKKRAEELANRLARTLADEGAAPSSLDDLAHRFAVPKSELYAALGALEADGRAVRVEKTLAYDVDALAQLEAAVEKRLADGTGTVADLREAMGVSRKYAVPVLEHFDRHGITVRDGDLRSLARKER